MKKELIKPITKWVLYKNAIQKIVIVGACFGIVLMVTLQIVTFLTPDPLSWQESIFFGVTIGIFLFLFLVGICSIGPLYGIARLIKQVASLNLSFSDEMKKNNITSTNYENYQWFISTDWGTVLAIHRDYINEIKKIDDPNGRNVRLIATVVKFDGNEMKITSSYDNISRFEQWFLQAEKEKSS